MRTCLALRGMEKWQPACCLELGHDGRHVWAPTPKEDIAPRTATVAVTPEAANMIAEWREDAVTRNAICVELEIRGMGLLAANLRELAK